MFGNTLQRAIGRELFKVFALALAVVTGILVFVGIVSEAAEYGLTPAELLASIPLIIPSFLPYTIPASTLFASCLVYGRLAHDNEIVAVRAAGIHLFCVVWPAVVFGAAATGATAGLYYHVIPTCQYRLHTQWVKAAEDFFYRMLQYQMRGDLPGAGYKLWVRDLKGRELIDVVFKRPGAGVTYDVVGHAQSAHVSIDTQHNQLLVHLKQGEILDVVRDTRILFTERTVPLRLANSWLTGGRGRSDMESTIPQLLGRREDIVQQIAQVDAALNAACVSRNLNAPPHPRPSPAITEEREEVRPAAGDAEACEEHVQADLDRRRNGLRFWLQRTDIQLSIRPAVAFSCFGFMLIGCPVGIWFRRKDYLSTFVACFIPTIGLYYPLLLRGIQLSERGRANPFVALWVGDMVLLAAGLVLVARLVRR